MNNVILENKYKISIIMPVYNTEKYVKRCIESVLRQSYKNIELIVVDDCSPGNIKEIVADYKKVDNRIQIVSHEKNKGLFQARLTGAKLATGEYIAFIDSDDYVSLDYYHTLLESVVNKNADIAIAHTVYEKPDGYRYIHNFHDVSFEFDEIEGEQVKAVFFEQKGLCYSWHTVWNKIYDKKLWDKCEPYYLRINEHVIMTEDIAFSSVLFYFAKKVVTVSNDAYFYCANETASTNSENISMEKFKKNMHDIKTVFDFVEGFLKEADATDKIKKDFHEFRKYYARMWNNVPNEIFKGRNAKEGRMIIKEFCSDVIGELSVDDHFFSSVETEWRGGLEGFKEQIINSKDEYISFDIFDTLVCRPFYNPTDLFEIIEKDFEKSFPSSLKFKQIRIDAEGIARNKHGIIHPDWKDITIDDIYDCISEMYDIPLDIVKKLQKREEELEIEFCRVRNAGRELFEVALLTGKKIIIVSDMYLRKDTIEKILIKNGYDNYEKLYISSEVKETKNDGELFRYVKRDMGMKSDVHIFHIGDTWKNDYINAEEAGFTPLFFPKAQEVFENKIHGVCTNKCSVMAEISGGVIRDWKKMRDSVGQGIMYAMVYNKYFDNPYRTFNSESDFNIDPYFIGYYVVGMHLIGVCRWIIQQTKQRGVGKIHFLARDGYLPMEAYKILARYCDDIPEANYLYASRKAVFTGMIVSVSDFYDLPIEYHNHSPKTLLKLLDFAYKEIVPEKREELCKNADIEYENNFQTKQKYIEFMHWFVNNLYDEEVFNQNRELAQKYYSCIEENDICFDMGYSGRIQKAISTLVGRGVDVLFIHSDNELSQKMQRQGDFSITNYYDFIPKVSGLLREHILSDCGPGCKGFVKEDDIIVPILEEEEKNFQDSFIVGMIQKGALDFVNEFQSMFCDYLKYIPFRYTEVSMPFEGYLCNAKMIDRRIFASSYFEDLVYGASDNINIETFINETIPYRENGIEQKNIIQFLENKNKFTKWIVCFIVDKHLFVEKVKEKLRKYPKLYKVVRKVFLSIKRR